MKELKLVEVDIEENLYRHNTNFFRFISYFAALIATVAIYETINKDNMFTLNPLTFLIIIELIILGTSLNRLIKLRKKISNLFNKKRELIKKLKFVR